MITELKQINRLLLLHYAAQCGTLQTRDMSRLLQLSRTATVNIQAEMLEAGLLTRTGTNDAIGYTYSLSLKGAETLIKFGELLKPYGSYSSFESPASTLLSGVQRRTTGTTTVLPPYDVSAVLFTTNEPKTGIQDPDDEE